MFPSGKVCAGLGRKRSTFRIGLAPAEHDWAAPNSVRPPLWGRFETMKTVDGASGDDLDLHPRADRAMCLPRLGYGQQGLVQLLVARGVRTTVAPLYYMGHNPELSLVPIRHRMGSVLDPCTQIRQKPWVERAESFRALPFGNDPEPYHPDRSRLTDQQLLALATSPIDAERGRGGTLLLTTFHVAGAIGTRGRDVELLLAETGIKHFRQQKMAEPPPMAAVDVPRVIYATVAVRMSDLMSPTARLRLVDAYLALGADGVWVKISGFHEKAAPAGIRAVGAFFAALREGPVPIVSCGAGQLHLALLADEISASIGVAESERFVVPATWKKKAKDGKRKGRTRMAYHPRLHCSFRVGSENARKAFRQAPCDCGAHAATKPPTGLLVAEHAAILRADQARDALGGDTEERREWVLGSAVKASLDSG